METPVTWDYYNYTTPNSLPSGTTLNNSISSKPLEWKALETYVGFSEIPELTYKDSGSYITDFFIDMKTLFFNLYLECHFMFISGKKML